MPLVMLKKTWPGGFRRNVRDVGGKIVRTLEFLPGEPLDVPPEDCTAIAADIGKALSYCELRDGKIKVLDPNESKFVPPVSASDESPENPPETDPEIPIPADVSGETSGDNPEHPAENAAENPAAESDAKPAAKAKGAKALLGKE